MAPDGDVEGGIRPEHLVARRRRRSGDAVPAQRRARRGSRRHGRSPTSCSGATGSSDGSRPSSGCARATGSPCGRRSTAGSCSTRRAAGPCGTPREADRVGPGSTRRVVAAAGPVPRRRGRRWSPGPALLTVGLALFEADLVRACASTGAGETSPSSPMTRSSCAALRNSCIYIAGAVPLRALAALGTGPAAAPAVPPAPAPTATAAYLPTVIPDVSFALAWLWILNPLYGPLNLALGRRRARRPGLAVRSVGGPGRAHPDQRASPSARAS